MASLTHRDEEALLDSVKTAASYLEQDESLTPTAAIEKVAREQKLGPGHTRALCHAYNNGQQIAQWGQGDSLLDKMASFPLADFDAIEARLWGDTEKAAADETPGVHTDYLFGPTWTASRELNRQKAANAAMLEKAAADAPPEPTTPTRPSTYTVFQKRAECLARLPQARGRFSDAREKAAVAVGALTDYFRRKHASERHALNDVAYAAQTFYGQPGRALCDLVASRLGEKLAADLVPFPGAMHRQAEPMNLVEDALGGVFGACQAQKDHDLAVKQAAVCDVLLSRRHKEAGSGLAWDLPAASPTEGLESSLIDTGLSKAASDREAVVSQFDTVFAGVEKASHDQLDFVLQFGAPVETEKEAADNAPKPDPYDTDLIKSAFMGFAGAAAIGSATKGMIDKALSSESEQQKVDQAYGSIATPEHEDELRSIRAQAALASMMSDPKNPVSGYEPGDVMESYNEIAETAPTVADTPMALRSMLSKNLSQGLEPFDVTQMADADKQLRAARTPSLMGNK